MTRNIRAPMLLTLAVAGCAASHSVTTDGRGIYVASGRQAASPGGVLIAQHQVMEQARGFCHDHSLRFDPADPLVDYDAADDEVLVLLRFRCADAGIPRQAKP